MAATVAARDGAAAEVLAREGAFDFTVGAHATTRPAGFYDWHEAGLRAVQPTRMWGTELSAGWRIGRGNVPPYYGQYDTLGGGEVFGTIRVPLLRDGATDDRRTELDRARALVGGAEAEADWQTRRIAYEASVAYWAWVAAGRAHVVTTRLVELAATRQTQVEDKVTAGHLPAFDALDNKRVLVGRYGDQNEALRKLQLKASELSLFYRDEHGRPVTLGAERIPADSAPAERAPALVPAEVARAVIRRRTDLAALRQQVNAERINLERAKNKLLPRLDLTASVSRDLGADDSQGRLPPSVLEAGVRFEIPIQRREARGLEAKSGAKIQELAAKLRYAEESVIAHLEQARTAWARDEETFRLSVEGAEIAEQIAAGERERFELGSTPLFMVTMREQAAAKARLEKVRAEFSLRASHAYWLLTTGE